MNKKIVPLSNISKAVILGSLLGDGSLKIHNNYANARFSFKHSTKQAEYFYWKVGLLKEIASENCVFAQKNDGYGGDKLRFQSRALDALTELYKLVTKAQKLRIRRKWLNLLTPLSLAIWWLDDGSLISNGRRGVFCTDGFEEKHVRVLSKYLKKCWDISTKVAPIKKEGGTKAEYFRIWIRSAEELKKFLRIILPHIKVKAMLPKALLLYKDDQLQERWISEVSDKTGFPVEEINKILLAKKAKWKKYSEDDIVQSI